MRINSQANATCLNCGKLFHIKPSAIRRGRGHFCCRKCKGNWMSKNQTGTNNPNYRNETLKCLTCSKEFKASPSLKRKYCSRQCYAKVNPNKKLDQTNLEQFLKKMYLEKKLSTTQIASSLKCDPKTVTYWMDKYSIPRRSHSEVLKLFNPAKRPEVREKMSRKAKLRGQSLEERKRRSERAKKLWANPKMRAHLRLKISRSLMNNKRRKGIPHSKLIRNKISITLKEHWKDPTYVKKVLVALQEEPNKSEKMLLRIIEENNFPFRYVGDGQVIIDGQIPDFIATDGSKKLIELFGEPWHDPNHSNKIRVKPYRTADAKQKFFAMHCYDSLIIWDKELRDEEKIINRIKDFLHHNLYAVEKPVDNPVPPAQ